jgi:hypothetical protein
VGSRLDADHPKKDPTGGPFCTPNLTVTVTSDGFVWQDQTYASLSAIARAITGTSWNGRRFFGLRIKADRAEAVR